MPELLTLIAQTSQPPGGAQPTPSLFGSPLMLFALFGVVIYFMMIRPQSKEKKHRAAMLAALKKNDRVVTIGGIIGTVLQVKDDEVTLKVDESSNTKITFSRSAIQTVTTSSSDVSDSGGSGKS
jgi:preprotein translocase subunit YajC